MLPPAEYNWHKLHMLTYTGPVDGLVAQQGRSTVEDGPARALKATAVYCRRVVFAQDVVEYYRTIHIPPKHLHTNAKTRNIRCTRTV